MSTLSQVELMRRELAAAVESIYTVRVLLCPSRDRALPMVQADAGVAVERGGFAADRGGFAGQRGGTDSRLRG
eukprot:1191177-Prorocentrum_minimum.AAC.1